MLLDTFDPLPYGFEPTQLDTLVGHVENLVADLDAIQQMLHGCTTPLNLRTASKTVGECQTAIQAICAELEAALLITSGDFPISGQFGAPSANWETGELEARAIEPGELLSPKQLLVLHSIQRGHPEYPSTTYRNHLTNSSTVPRLILDAIAREVKQAQKNLRDQQLLVLQEASPEILADVESRPCPSCDVLSSEFCKTSSGRIAEKPHRPRIRLSPAALSNPEAAAVMSRQHEAYEEFYGHSRESS